MPKPIEVTNIQYPTAMAEPVGSGPMSKGGVFVAGLVVGLLIGSGAVSCDNHDAPAKNDKAAVQSADK